MTKTRALHNPNDGELLKNFLTANDQDSFTELTHRHERMVLDVARHVLREANKAQDIAQASFLTLVRKGDQFKNSISVEAWLHHVAFCLARNERLKDVRRKKHEEEAAMYAVDPEESLVGSEHAMANVGNPGKVCNKKRETAKWVTEEDPGWPPGTPGIVV